MIDELANLKNLYNNDKLCIQATNIWLSSDIKSDSMKNHKQRGNEPKTNYNMFVRITGVEDPAEYSKELFYWKSKLEGVGKSVLVLEDISAPSVDEVNKISPGNYMNISQLVSDLANKIKCPYPDLRNQVIKAFVETMVEEHQNTTEIFGKLRVKAISILSWFSRYGRLLFKENSEHLPVIIYFGTCKNRAEVLFFKFLASLPIDVILINPILEETCMLTDARLFEKKYSESMKIKKFPSSIEEINNGTAAYRAEQDLETILYQDSGLYKNRQYRDAVVIPLKTMYEELYILWPQEIKMRPNFETLGDKVIVPAIIAKVSGVKNRDELEYWRNVKKLVNDDTMFITNVNFYNKETEKFDTNYALKNMELKKANLVRNKDYQFGIYQERIQEYVIDKLEDLLKSGLIVGTFTHGVEHTIIKVIMNLDKQIMRLIQNMDFTKNNPKIVLVNTGETEYPLEEAITLAFLHLVGFDIVMFVPSGYRLVERHFTKPLFIEHEIGEFMYDAKMPDYLNGRKYGESKKQSEPNEQGGFFRKIFGAKNTEV